MWRSTEAAIDLSSAVAPARKATAASAFTFFDVLGGGFSVRFRPLVAFATTQLLSFRLAILGAYHEVPESHCFSGSLRKNSADGGQTGRPEDGTGRPGAGPCRGRRAPAGHRRKRGKTPGEEGYAGWPRQRMRSARGGTSGCPEMARRLPR